MKRSITAFLTAMLIAGAVTVFADKLPKRESVHIPSGRSITMQARINKLGHAYGTITVDFKINRKGEVIWAEANKVHTTVMDKAFVHKVEDAVKDMKFNKAKRAPMSQNGSIAYSFR
ncbi:hypothetical protein [Mucilaginibacter sp. dw_454]|uniref:hypothetical protein n=1 Tax=Mucilaginibacter sp. dw_454 TaxID=2720079 RepID=UPI001BD33042|nr:hypothetical protein [Mucilaginibacter sp. dw_454]